MSEVAIELRPFPDSEATVMTWLETTFPELATEPGARADGGDLLHVDEVPPPDLALCLPFVAVSKIDGNDDAVTDRSVLDIDVWDETRNDALGLAERIRARLIRYPHRVGEGSVVIIDFVLTETAPRRLPWADEGIHRFGSTFRISARR